MRPWLPLEKCPRAKSSSAVLAGCMRPATFAELSVNGQTKTVHVGDQLSDGSLVTAITATGVSLKKRA